MDAKLGRKLAFAAVRLAAAVGLLLAVTFFGTAYVGKISADIRAANTRANIQQQQPQRIQALRASYDKVKDDIPLLENALPENKFETLLPFTSALSNLASAKGVTAVLTVTNKPNATPEGYEYLPITIQFRSSRAAFESYVAGFEKLPFFFQIDSASIADPVNINGISDVKIEARVYVREAVSS